MRVEASFTRWGEESIVHTVTVCKVLRAGLGEREGWREGRREGEWERGREGWREGGRERGRERGRKGRREGGRERREGGREGGRERGREEYTVLNNSLQITCILWNPQEQTWKEGALIPTECSSVRHDGKK